MIKYVCIGCGFETSDENFADEPCPYCGELMFEEDKAQEQQIEDNM